MNQPLGAFDSVASFDPYDPRQTQHMWDRFPEIRAKYPISRPGEFVFVARYEDVLWVMRQPQRFGNRQGFRAAGVEVPLPDCLIGELDPPQHQPIRRLVTHMLVPATIEQVTPFTERVARERIAKLADAGGGDLVGDLTMLLPTEVTAKVLGLPTEDAPQLARWANELLHSEWPATNRTERGEGLVGAFPEYAAYIDRHVASRREASNPPDDLLSELTRAEVFGAPVSDRQIRALVSNLILGGISTSTSMLGNLLHHLLSCPTDHEALRKDSTLTPRAVEESLRLHPPILYVVRTCLEPVEIAGFPVEAGERVILSIASANRDESVYPDAESFRLDRVDPKPHLSFAQGPHLCLGAGLARMVGSVVTRAFTARFASGDITLAPHFELTLTPVFMEYGPSRLPVILRGGS